MAEAFVGEIRMFAGNFAPAGWALCNGQLQSISQNAALFSLIGTTYGGDGQTTFGLPELRGRVPVHQGTGPGLSNRVIGQRAGEESVTLTQNQIPAHSHTALADSNAGTQTSPAGNVWAASNYNPFTPSSSGAQLNAGALGNAGGNQPHDNQVPFLTVNFIISLFGVFPSQN
jgi:microcystin-dependent protein